MNILSILAISFCLILCLSFFFCFHFLTLSIYLSIQISIDLSLIFIKYLYIYPSLIYLFHLSIIAYFFTLFTLFKVGPKNVTIPKLFNKSPNILCTPRVNQDLSLEVGEILCLIFYRYRIFLTRHIYLVENKRFDVNMQIFLNIKPNPSVMFLSLS